MDRGRLIEIENDLLRGIETDSVARPAAPAAWSPRCHRRVIGIVRINRFRRQTREPEHDALSVRWPFPVHASDPSKVTFRRLRLRALVARSSAATKAAAAFIGPIVCEDDGPIPILNRSKTLIITATGHRSRRSLTCAFSRGMISRAMVST